MSPALTLNDVSLGYPDRLVLTDISLEVEAGEVFAIVGPNGVGKSTLIKAASGILPLQAGRIEVDGGQVTEWSPDQRARRIAVVPQATHVPPAFSARQVVAMGRTPYLGWLEREGPADRAQTEAALERTATMELAERPMGELSGGERQRVLIARALAQSAAVMLLDEPTAHLDLRHQDQILKLIQALAHDEGLAVLIALHDLNLVARFADRVALLSNGTVRKKGDPRQVLTPTDLAAAYGIEIHVMDHPVYGTPLVLSG
ncbi:MAG: heme ABC transporter ATP-binding protein [Anaerolineales bacterium]